MGMVAYAVCKRMTISTMMPLHRTRHDVTRAKYDAARIRYAFEHKLPYICSPLWGQRIGEARNPGPVLRQVISKILLLAHILPYAYSPCNGIRIGEVAHPGPPQEETLAALRVFGLAAPTDSNRGMDTRRTHGPCAGPPTTP
eukprot:4909267-Pyramimonas_sp.AAC.1